MTILEAQRLTFTLGRLRSLLILLNYISVTSNGHPEDSNNARVLNTKANLKNHKCVAVSSI